MSPSVEQTIDCTSGFSLVAPVHRPHPTRGGILCVYGCGCLPNKHGGVKITFRKEHYSNFI